MNKAARHVLRKLGTDESLDTERQQRLAREVQEEQQRQKAAGTLRMDGQIGQRR